MPRFAACLLLLLGIASPVGAVLTNTYREGVSGPANSANIDTFARKDQPTTNFGTDVTATVGVTNGATKVFHAWHEFVISDIPAGSTITGCTLKIQASNIVAPTAGHLYRVCSQHWTDGNAGSEVQATWNVWATAQSWGTAGGTSTTACASGGDIDTTNGVAYAPPSIAGSYTFPDMTALCQDALDTRSGHLRLLVAQDSEVTQSNQFDYKLSDTTSATARPLLSVSFNISTTTTTSTSSSTTTSTTIAGNVGSLTYTIRGTIDGLYGSPKSIPFTCFTSGGSTCQIRTGHLNGMLLEFQFPDANHLQLVFPSQTICDATTYYTPVDAATSLAPAAVNNTVVNCRYEASGNTLGTVLTTNTLPISRCWSTQTTFRVRWTAFSSATACGGTPSTTSTTTSTTLPYAADCATYGLTSSAIGPDYAPVMECASLSHCCSCATAGACTGACSQTGAGWESAIESAQPSDVILLQAGTYTPVTNNRLDFAGGTSTANYVTVANDTGAAVTIAGAVNFKGSTLGYLRISGLSFLAPASQYVIHAERTSTTALTDVRFDYVDVSGGTDTAIKGCGNISQFGVSHSTVDGGRDHHGIKFQCSENGSCDSSPTHEPCTCDFAPDFYLTNDHVTRETAFTYSAGEDNLQTEGWGSANIWCSVFDRNVTGEDCVDLKGEGTIGAIMQFNRNEMDATTCRQNGLLVHGNHSSLETGRFWYNHFIGLPTDGVKFQTTSAANVRGNFFDNATLDLENHSGSLTCQATLPGTALVVYNTWVGGRLRIGTGSSGTGNCLPSLILANNIFSGTEFDQRDVTECAAPGGPIYDSLDNNVVFNTTGDELRMCSSSRRTCDANGDCPSGQTCLSASNSSPTRITGDPLLTSYHISTSSPAKDTATGNYTVPEDLDQDHRPQGCCFDVGADEFNIGPTTTTSTSSTTSTSGPTTSSTSTSTSTTSTSSSTSTTSTTLLLSYQDGVSGPANVANMDTFARADQATTNFGTTSTATVGVGNTTAKVFHAWHEFDLSAIPASSTVTFCEFAIHAQNVVAPTAGHVYRVCSQHWSNGVSDDQVTWTVYVTGNAWTTLGGTSTTACGSGGDITTTSGVAYTAPIATGTYTFPSLVALCQDAVTNQSGHLRLIVKQDTESVADNRFDYKLSETTTLANRPALTVAYY